MKKLPGVASASADAILLSLLCEHDASQTTPAAIVEAIVAAGYGAEVVGKFEQDDAFGMSSHGEY